MASPQTKPAVLERADADSSAVGLRHHMEALLRAVHERIDDLRGYFEARIDDLRGYADKRFDSVDKRMDRMLAITITLWLFAMGVFGAGYAHVMARMDRMDDKLDQMMILLAALGAGG